VAGTFLTFMRFYPVAPVRKVKRGDVSHLYAFLSRFTRQLAKLYEKQQLEHINGIDGKTQIL
jgi:hypothetical protein